MRFLVVHPGPFFSVQDCYTGWVEGLRENGQLVAQYNLGDRLLFYDAVVIDTGEKLPDGQADIRKALDSDQAMQLAVNGLLSSCYQYWPDVVFIVSAFFVPTEMLDLIRARGHKVVILHTEAPYEDQRQLKLAPHADLNLLNDPTNIEAFEAIAPTVYSPHAYREHLHCPGPSDAKPSDLVFVGTGYPSRVEFFEAMDLDGLDVALAGNWLRLPEESPLRGYVVHDTDDCFENEDAVPLYRAARAGINLYRREAQSDGLVNGWSCGPREIELASAGCFFLRDPRPEGDHLFAMLPTFDGPGDASEKLRWYLARDELRQDLASQARAAVAERTFTNHAAQLLRLLDRQPANV